MSGATYSVSDSWEFPMLFNAEMYPALDFGRVRIELHSVGLANNDDSQPWVQIEVPLQSGDL